MASPSVARGAKEVRVRIAAMAMTRTKFKMATMASIEPLALTVHLSLLCGLWEKKITEL